MDDLEGYIEKLQNLSHDVKKKIMWIGVPIIMFVIIFVWFSYTDFGLKTDDATNNNEQISKLKILKNGFMVTLKDAGNLLKDFKEKINQTNTFEITAPEQNLENTSSSTKIINN